MSAKKSTSAKASVKKDVSKVGPVHPPWIDMIKECISAHTEEARLGVSRPQIKKYVETNYNLTLGAAQVTQLSKAITVGAEKGVFVLPKGPSGRVKLAPKVKAEVSATKENKPTSKAKPVSTSIAKPAVAKSPKAAPAKATKAVKASPKPKGRPGKVTKKAPVEKKPTPRVTPKKVLASKAKPVAAKKAATAKRVPAKKAVTGSAPAAKVKKAVAKTVSKPAAKSATKRKAPMKRS